MKRVKPRTMALGACFFLIVLCLMLGVFWPAQEPRYQSRPLSAWVLELPPLGGLDFQRHERTRAKASEAVRAIGVEGVPFYLKWIAYEPSRFRAFLQRILLTIRPNALLPDSSLLRAEASLDAIAILGTNATTAVPELTDLLFKTQSKMVLSRTAYALGHIGPAAAPTLKQAAAHPDPHLRSCAMLAMDTRWIDFYLDTLFERLSDSDASLRKLAKGKIVFGSAHTDAHFRSLTNALINPNPAIRTVAVAALEQYGSTCLPIVQTLSADTNADVRAAVRTAIHNLRYE